MSQLLEEKNNAAVLRESVQRHTPGVVLEAIGLTKHYGERAALDSLSLGIAPGEVVCLLGANGAGKTTTIKLFLNEITPTSGIVRIKGLDVVNNPVETKRHIAYIPEQVMLYGNLTGIENLEYFVALSGQSFSRRTLSDFLTEAGLRADAACQRVCTYSKGMRQKVGIALAMAKHADALLLDEPTSGLDPKAANEFSDLVRRMSRRGAAILMVTHDIFRAKEMATRVGIMKGGRLVDMLDAGRLDVMGIERVYLEHMHD